MAAATASLRPCVAESGTSSPSHDAERERPRFDGAVTARGPLLLLLTAVLLAGCGGSSSSSDPGSKNYDPATTTLKAAGLAVCSDATQDVPPTLTSVPGLGATRGFYVAKDCKGAKKTPNTVIVFQFTNLDSIGPGEQAIKRALPTAAVLQHYPLVIATTGPDKDANLSAVEQQLPPVAVTTTT